MNMPRINFFNNHGTCRCLIDLRLGKTPEDIETAWAWLMNKYNDAGFIMRLIEAWREEKETMH